MFHIIIYAVLLPCCYPKSKNGSYTLNYTLLRTAFREGIIIVITAIDHSRSYDEVHQCV